MSDVRRHTSVRHVDHSARIALRIGRVRQCTILENNEPALGVASYISHMCYPKRTLELLLLPLKDPAGAEDLRVARVHVGAQGP